MVFARRRTTGIRPVLPWAPVRIAACAVAVAVTAPCPVQPAAQDTAAGRDATSAWLAAYPPDPASSAVPRRWRPGADVVEICVEQVHIGGPPDDEGNDIRVVTACDEAAGNRFSMPLTFDQAGRYGLQVDSTIQPDGETEPTEVSSSFMTGITVE